MVLAMPGLGATPPRDLSRHAPTSRAPEPCQPGAHGLEGVHINNVVLCQIILKNLRYHRHLHNNGALLGLTRTAPGLSGVVSATGVPGPASSSRFPKTGTG